MKCGVSKASTAGSRIKSPYSAQQKLLAAVASTGAGRHVGNVPPEDLYRLKISPVQARKRRLHATFEGDPLPAKRARSTRTDIPQPGVEDREVEQAAKATRQEPKPKSPTRPHASSIEPKVHQPVSPATRLRKRQIGSNSDGDGNDNEHQLKRARLTQKNLALFDKMGKKKAPDLTEESRSTKTTSTTTFGFADKAYQNGILHPPLSRPPKNLEDIRKRYTKTRGTASPPESLLKKYYDKGYNRAFNRPCTGLAKDVGYNNGLSAPQPDFIEGLGKEEFRPFPVAEYVPGATLYQDDPFTLILPHVAGEWKGPDGSMREAELQSAYDGAAMVYARNRALAYIGKSEPPGHAEITTFTTDGTNLNMYAHYATPSSEDRGTLEYHQYQYASTNIKDSYQGHKDGRKGLRNSQDHAKTQSYTLRDQLKEHWKRQRGTPHSITAGAYLPASDLELPTATSADLQRRWLQTKSLAATTRTL